MNDTYRDEPIPTKAVALRPIAWGWTCPDCHTENEDRNDGRSIIREVMCRECLETFSVREGGNQVPV